MMQTYVIKRLLLIVPVLVLISVLSFFLMRLVPGDVLLAQIGQGGLYSPQKLAQIRARLGLSSPLVIQLLRWLGGLSHGDFGRSLLTDQPTLNAFFDAAKITVELGILAILIGLIIAIPIGVLSATKQNTPIDYIGRVIATIGISAPAFWIGTAFIVFAGLWWHYSVSPGYISIFANPLGNLKQLSIPAFIEGFQSSAVTMRLVRATMLEVMRQEYVRTARAKGLRSYIVITRHALRNALIPVVTVIGSQVGYLLGGTVVVETLFNLPGAGALTFNAIIQRDYAQVQTNVLIFGALVILANLATDLACAGLDPRIRYT